MSGLFSKPKPPPIVQAPPVPTIDEATRDEEFSRKMRRRRGRGGQVFSSATARSNPSVGAKQLLGG